MKTVNIKLSLGRRDCCLSVPDDLTFDEAEALRKAVGHFLWQRSAAEVRSAREVV